LRGEDLEFRDRYFERNANGYKLKPKVRTTVRFSRDNLLDPAFMQGRQQYDVVFCRNLLIYFDAAGWAHATRTLQQLLKDSGLLFMGHAELLNLRSTLFESIRVPLAFAYRKRVEKPAEAPAAARASSQKAVKGAHRKADSVIPRRGKTRNRLKPQTSAPEATPVDKLLDDATQLADQGELARAAGICRRCLAENPASARSYALLGLIAEVEGKTAEAEEHYRRALYLDSQNYETMVHLALLLEGRGDAAGDALRKRARNFRRQT